MQKYNNIITYPKEVTIILSKALVTSVFIIIFAQNKPVMNNKKDYDLLIVGAGIYGATAAYKAKQEGKRCLVIDIRPHLGGNIYCENIEGINVHVHA